MLDEGGLAGLARPQDQGRAARRQAQQALDDDPLSGLVNTGMVLVHLFTGAFDAGLNALFFADRQ